MSYLSLNYKLKLIVILCIHYSKLIFKSFKNLVISTPIKIPIGS